MIIAGTGHRPDKLGGYNAQTIMRVNALATTYLREAKPTLVISGMAQGWDMSLAQASINLGIPFDAYIPFQGQEQVWPLAARCYYQELLKHAREVKICSPGGFSTIAMTRRNRCMVDDCDKLVALWDGTAGGTGNCIAYANFARKRYINLWSLYDTAPKPQQDLDSN
jgi:uncharacterized phage-like protein YoqJ